MNGLGNNRDRVCFRRAYKEMSSAQGLGKPERGERKLRQGELQTLGADYDRKAKTQLNGLHISTFQH